MREVSIGTYAIVIQRVRSTAKKGCRSAPREQDGPTFNGLHLQELGTVTGIETSAVSPTSSTKGKVSRNVVPSPGLV